jgi:cell wall-associated NlpC family hydrolase
MIGAPYKHLGRNRAGMDCLGLLLHTYEEDERDFAEVVEELTRLMSYYGERKWTFKKAKDGHRRACILLRESLSKRAVEVSIHRVLPGDFFLMRYKTDAVLNPDLGDHVAVYVGNQKIVHADMRAGVTEMELTKGHLRRIVAVFRKR